MRSWAMGFLNCVGSWQKTAFNGSRPARRPFLLANVLGPKFAVLACTWKMQKEVWPDAEVHL